MGLNSFYSKVQLSKLGFKSLGTNILISKNAKFYDARNIEIGSNVRIDDFCVLSGKIVIKDYVHISTGVTLIAGDTGIEIGNHCCVSVKTSVFAISDDFNGLFLVGPMEELSKRNVIKKKIILENYSVVGANSILLPGAYLSEGTVVGALSLVKEKLKPFAIYCGCPCRYVRERKKDFLKL